eukprot:6225839-Alexandrium_andersonii.AAC.2
MSGVAICRTSPMKGCALYSHVGLRLAAPKARMFSDTLCIGNFAASSKKRGCSCSRLLSGCSNTQKALLEQRIHSTMVTRVTMMFAWATEVLASGRPRGRKRERREVPVGEA